MKIKHLVATSFVAMVLAAPSALATPIDCTATNGGNLGAASTDDVTLNGTDSTSCYVDGGNSGGGGGSMISQLGSGWTQLFSYESSGTTLSTGPINGVTFSNYSISPTAGTFGFDFSGGPAYIDFVFSAHAGGNSGYFLFDEFLLSPASGSGAGLFVIQWNAGNSSTQGPGFSNGQFWAKPGTTTICTDCDTGGHGASGTVPEPSSTSLALLGVAMLAVTFLRRRKARSA